MKKLYLHIGTEKTGTTTLQEVLFQNRSLLSERGVHFVQSAGERNNRALPSYCMDDEHFDDFFSDRAINSLEGKNEFKRSFLQEFEDEIFSLPNHIHSVVITSEHFHSRTVSDTEVERVYDFFSQYFSEIVVICYVREQVSACVSLYSTIIKSGGSPKIDDLINACHPGNIYYNHYQMLKKWAQNFGQDALVVKPFERQHFVNQDLIDDFFSNIDLSLIPLINKDIVTLNESLTTTGQFIGRAINQALPRYLADGSINQKRIHATNQLYLDFKGKGQATSKEQYDIIFSSFQESNDHLNREFMSALNLETCFSYQPPTSENLTAELNESDVDKLVNVFSAIDKNSYYLTDDYADLFRDLALDYEDKNLDISVKLMTLAKKMRPHGPFINKKLENYHDRKTR